MTGVVLGSFSPLHKGHMKLIYKARKLNDSVIIVVCGHAGDKGDKCGMPLEERFDIIEDFFDDKVTRVIKMDDDEMGIAGYTDKWDVWLSSFLHQLDDMTNQDAAEELVWYVGESEYAQALREHGFTVEETDREELPISATMIRCNPMKYWDDIAYPFRHYFQKRILVIGTASEGKTTLVQDVAKYQHFDFSEEYAHEWQLEELSKGSYKGDTALTFDDFYRFLSTQYKWNRSSDSSKIIICDSDAVTTLLYAYCYGENPQFALTQKEYKELYIAATAYYMSRWDKIFLIPPQKDSFVSDGTREETFSSYSGRQFQYKTLVFLMRKFNYMQKTEVLYGNYYENFKKVINYTNSVINPPELLPRPPLMM